MYLGTLFPMFKTDWWFAPFSFMPTLASLETSKQGGPNKSTRKPWSETTMYQGHELQHCRAMIWQFESTLGWLVLWIFGAYTVGPKCSWLVIVLQYYCFPICSHSNKNLIGRRAKIKYQLWCDPPVAMEQQTTLQRGPPVALYPMPVYVNMNFKIHPDFIRTNDHPTIRL